VNYGIFQKANFETAPLVIFLGQELAPATPIRRYQKSRNQLPERTHFAPVPFRSRENHSPAHYRDIVKEPTAIVPGDQACTPSGPPAIRG